MQPVIHVRILDLQALILLHCVFHLQLQCVTVFFVYLRALNANMLGAGFYADTLTGESLIRQMLLAELVVYACPIVSLT